MKASLIRVVIDKKLILHGKMYLGEDMEKDRRNKKWGVVVVDDHQMFRDAIRYILDQSDNAYFVDHACSGRTFLKQLHKYKDHIILMDLTLPDISGIETTARAIAKYPDLKIIALSMLNDNYQYYEMLNAGALGVILKESGSSELLEAIETIGRGEPYLTGKILDNIIRSSIPEKNREKTKGNKAVPLSKVELVVLKHISLGLSTKEIADRMDLSSKTIESIRTTLLVKTGTANSIKLILYALENGIV